MDSEETFRNNSQHFPQAGSGLLEIESNNSLRVVLDDNGITTE